MESVGKQTIVQVEKTGIKFYDQEGVEQEVSSDVAFEPIAIPTEGDATVVNVDNEMIQIKDIVKAEISSIAFSPKKTYLVACTKHVEGQKNLFILDKTMAIAAEHVWKGNSKEGCKNVSWGNDEKYMVRKEAPSSKSLYIYEVAESLDKEVGVITQKDKVTNFALAPHGGVEDKPHFLLVGTCGETSSLTRFYQLPNFEKEKFKNLSKGGHEIDFVFAPNGHAVIIWTQFVVDNTGQSYYGQHDLRYVQLGGGNKRSKVAVFDNQVSDVAWSPDSQDFIVISGKQPAVVTMYTNNCVPTFEFGRIHVNTIRYSPFSNLVLFGGFGNLVGRIEVWNKDTFKLIGVNKAHCAVVCEWSPDGSQILAAVTHPRVRVDNEVKVFTYFGKKVQHRKIENLVNELHFAGWQPQDLSSFEKIEVPEDFEKYDAEEDPDEIKNKPKPVAKKGFLNLPKSTAFGNMMRAEMNSATTQGPRKLKKDDYKEYLIETVEEKNALKVKPKPKAKAAPKASWRNNGGFKIPSKAEQEAEQKKHEEEKKQIPAATEYKPPAPKPEPKKPQPGKPQAKNQNAQNKQGKKKRNNRNKKKKKGGPPVPSQETYEGGYNEGGYQNSYSYGNGQEYGNGKEYSRGYGGYNQYDY